MLIFVSILCQTLPPIGSSSSATYSCGALARLNACVSDQQLHRYYFDFFEEKKKKLTVDFRVFVDLKIKRNR